MNSCRRYNASNNEVVIDNIYRGLVLCCNFVQKVRTVHQNFDYDDSNLMASLQHGQNVSPETPHLSKSGRKRRNRKRNKAAAAAAAAASATLPNQQVESLAICEEKKTETKKATKTVVATESITFKPTKALTYTRPHFCFKNADTAQQLRGIAYHFQNDIKMLQSRLDAKVEANIESEQDLTLAKIWIENNQPITSVIFEFIRSEIIGWIGNFQHQELDTPIFNGMFNENNHIRIVCENHYAYQCLEICITEVAQTQAGQSIFIQQLPMRSSHTLYCFDAVYEEIIDDPDLFLIQVKLHKKQLRSQYWIVVEHEVYTEKRETHFMFLLDEYSALLIHNSFNNQLFVCMQAAKFTNRGRIPADD